MLLWFYIAIIIVGCKKILMVFIFLNKEYIYKKTKNVIVILKLELYDVK